MSTADDQTRPTYVPEPATPAAAATAEEVEERTLAGHRIQVTLERPGGAVEVHVLRVDNRDFVRWDMTAPRQKWGTAKEVPFLFQTFLSWSAGKRAGLELPPFEAYREQVLEAKDVKDDQDDEDDEARPTQ